MDLEQFTTELASSSPTPGGGGASALAGALAAALSSMVCNLTSGKKKYAQYETDIARILDNTEACRKRLLTLIDRDAECFKPLAKAYSLSKTDPKKSKVMEVALKGACDPPMQIMSTSLLVLRLLKELLEKGSTMVISDVGVGAELARAAVLGASLNVYINTKSMKNTEYADKLRSETKIICDSAVKIADEIFASVMEKLQSV